MEHVILARRFTIALWLLAVLGLGATILDVRFRLTKNFGETLVIADAIDAANLCLVPSGRTLRHPSIAHPAIDLRMVPGLDHIAEEPALLILSTPSMVWRGL